MKQEFVRKGITVLKGKMSVLLQNLYVLQATDVRLDKAQLYHAIVELIKVKVGR